MNIVKTAEEIGKLHALCEKAFADESGYGEVHSLSDRGIYRTFRDGFFAANRVLGKELRAELAELRARADIPIAWLTEDGERCVTARTMNGAVKDGGAIRSSLSAFTVPAYPVAAAVPDDVAKDAMLIYEKALVKLATLGNEPLLGNSSGNVIAQDALAQAAAILSAKENKP